MKRSVLALVLCAAPAISRAHFDKSKWGMTLSQIRSAYPGGQVQPVGQGETLYRIVRRASDLPPALWTFCLAYGERLNYVAVEFIDPKKSVDLKTGDYSRPTKESAVKIHEQLRKVLTPRYGKHERDEWDADTGGIAVWKQERGDFVAVDFTVVDDGRMNVLLRTSSFGDQRPLTPTQDSFQGSFARTDPGTWSSEGAFSVKWGMGPADVKAVYPDLHFLWSSPQQPVKTYIANLYVEGRVGVHFEFYKGRLVEFTLSPFLASLSDRGNHKTDEELEQYWSECDYWRKRVLEIVKGKYGTPSHGPTAQEVAAAEKEGGDRAPLAWYFRRNDTGIALDQQARGMPRLLYADIEKYDEAHQAREAHENAKQQTRNARF